MILPALAAAVSAPVGAWVNSRLLRQKYRIELEKMQAEMRQTVATVHTAELENVKKASEILMDNIVKPLEKEMKSLRRDVEKFRKAIEKIPSCSLADSCPVSRELLDYEARERCSAARREQAGIR